MKSIILRVNKSRNWFFEKINKINKPLSRFIEKKRERTQINTTRNETGGTTNDTPKIQRKSKSFWKQMKMNSTIQNLWDTAKAVLRGKFIAIQAYIKRIKTAQINNLTIHLQELKEQQQRQPTGSRRKEITKIRAELNDIESKTQF